MTTTTEIEIMIEKAKAKGHKVFSPQKLTSYFWFVDGNRIGYCQFSTLEGATFTTVHRPSQGNGTGFRASSFEEALGLAPNWADSRTVQKYKNWEDFAKNHWQSLVER